MGGILFTVIRSIYAFSSPRCRIVSIVSIIVHAAYILISKFYNRTLFIFLHFSMLYSLIIYKFHL